MTENIVVQVGQCGNQIGWRFWDLALKEQMAVNPDKLYTDAIASFFHNSASVEGRTDGRTTSLTPYQRVTNLKYDKFEALKARAVLVDMEEGVVSEVLNGPLGKYFDNAQLITDVSGSGNNWAVGHHFYGSKYEDRIVDVLREATERCDALSSFFVLHSMGGGTGSGVGSRILRILADEFPDVHRFVSSLWARSKKNPDKIAIQSFTVPRVRE